MSKLVIVESPAKAKTIQKYLGDGYAVIASMGHVRDLPKSKLGVDTDNGFLPRYETIKGKESIIASIKSAAKKANAVLLATDPDREGEAISWHLAELLALTPGDKNRVTFNEITKSGIQNGIDSPRTIDNSLVDAQQARRVLDRIVGYKLSPFLWRKVRTGLSAGRVQSVAVRLISDREDEIRAFVAEEYWTIDAKCKTKDAPEVFDARLALKNGKKITLPDEKTAEKVLQELAGVPFSVSNVKTSIRRRSPAPPFITSTLQQDASRKLGFQARRTMRAAQELYEGVEIKGYGAVGLITYMRTDSLRISDQARQEAEKYITDAYSKEYLPPSRRVYKSRSNAQDGHEAIRPTMPSLSPDAVKKDLTPDQYKIYKLVWERFIASQMANALLDTVSIDIQAGPYILKASGYSVRFDGFTALYEEGRDEEEEKSKRLPVMSNGESIAAQSVDKNQHFTQPPPRYTEASLIKTLEENGIGRPSTYAPTITTILSRGYVERSQKLLIPTPLGETVTNLLKEQFPSIVDVAFTANLELDLDRVESGEKDWVDTISRFYEGFAESMQQAEKNMEGKRVKVPDEPTDVVCEKCGKNMVIKTGRYGKFMACPGFPECRNIKKIVQETGGLCPLCGGKVLAKKSKAGRGYFGCENNPTCGFMTWDKPVTDVCPECGTTLFKKTGRNGTLHCLKEGCKFGNADKPESRKVLPDENSKEIKKPKETKKPKEAKKSKDVKKPEKAKDEKLTDKPKGAKKK
jgi:DNA topoisomerase-1